MALQLHDLTAWIAMGDQDLGMTVYGVEKPHLNHVSCWIASEPGKKFSVNWRNATRAFPLQATVTIDGVKCNSHTMLDAHSYPNRLNSVGISFARTSEYTQRDFMFAPIQVTDDDAYLDAVPPRELPFGVITLEIYPLQVLSVVSQPTYHIYSQTLEPQTVHSRSNWAGSHQVRYGDEYISPVPMLTSSRVIQLGIRRTLRSASNTVREMLVANGVIPPPPREWKIVIDRKTEIAQLEARLTALRAKSGHPYPIAGSSRGQNSKKGSNPKPPRKSKTKKASAETVIDPTIANLD